MTSRAMRLHAHTSTAIKRIRIPLLKLNPKQTIHFNVQWPVQDITSAFLREYVVL